MLNFHVSNSTFYQNTNIYCIVQLLNLGIMNLMHLKREVGSKSNEIFRKERNLGWGGGTGGGVRIPK
jgi:hypothetical protein